MIKKSWVLPPFSGDSACANHHIINSMKRSSNVWGTGWFAANVKPGKTVAVIGDSSVGLPGVLSAKQMGAERIIPMSRHESRQKLAREFGATEHGETSPQRIGPG